MKKYSVQNYTINEDLTVDVKGGVNISGYKLVEIPFSFGVVDGYFDCGYNNLKNLIGCPVKVGGSFLCVSNDLTSLEGCPVDVGSSILCSNNKLTSLVGCPVVIIGEFNCSNNLLGLLESCPKSIGGNFNCYNNRIDSFVCGLESVGGYIDCRGNSLSEDDIFIYDYKDYNHIRQYYKNKSLSDELSSGLVEINVRVKKG